jgi:serine phosphatase RsbU (regulator of sigma subunit)
MNPRTALQPLRSLRVKFVLYFVGFMTGSLLLLARSLFEQEHNALLGELQKRLGIQVANLEVQAREALETNDDLQLLTTLRGLRSMDDFVFAAVLHPDGTVFAHSDVRLVGTSLQVPVEAAPLGRGATFREVRAPDGESRLEVWTPVLSTLRGRPEHIGIACVSVSKAPLLVAVDAAKLAAVRVGVLFVVLGIVGTALIARTVTQPIGKLVHGVQRIAAGDLQHKVDLRRADEIGLLSDSFDRMTDELQRAQQEILKQQLYEKELEVAGKIQAALLPAGPPRVAGYDVAALSAPARVVGGDFYDYLTLRDGRTAFLVADVAGKGVSAGLVMAAARSAARSAFSFTPSPYEALAALNAQLLRDFDHSTFVTVLCMVLEPQSGVLQVANAGHPPLLCWRAAEQRIELVRLRGVALGILPEARFGAVLEPVELRLDPADLVLAYSDGVSETHDREGRLFGEERLGEFVAAHAELEPTAFLEALRRELERFSQGFGQFDDITALALRASPVRRLRGGPADQEELVAMQGGG